ncbi:MAG TPA: hypothetical protein PL033_08455 [Candidatus Brocadiia bacterium]|nr:hypothetical protein [Candidatus Brocadiia bacterium]
MQRISGDDSNRIVYKGGGGCLTLFGLVFAFFGFMPVLGALGLVRMEGSAIGGLIVGLIFIAAGCAIAFGRSGLIIDLGNGTYSKWWGIIVPFQKTSGPISDFTLVRMNKEIRKSKNSTYTVYPVRIATIPGKSAKNRLDVSESRNAQESRTEAEFLAKNLKLDLEDLTLGEKVVRAHDELDESLRDRVRKGEAITGQLGPPPSGMRSQCRIEGRSVEIEIPPPGLDVPTIVGVVASCVIFPAIVIFIFLRPFLQGGMAKGPGIVFVAFFAFFILAPFIFGAGAIIRALFVKTIVRASPDGISVRKSGPFPSAEKSIPSTELEELVIGPKVNAPGVRGSPIVARSDRLTLSFGDGLGRAEQQWLLTVLRKIVTA